MALSLEDKKTVVAEVSAVAGEALSAVAAEYRGLSVEQMTALRVEARNAGVYLRVVKNTLAKRAIAGTDFECMQDALKGPLLIAFAKDDPGASARIIKNFAKENDQLKAVAMSTGGQLMGADQLDALASLPTLDEARGMLVGMLAAPGSQLVRLLAEPGAMLSRTLNAYATRDAA